jgi:hypothetical protein
MYPPRKRVIPYSENEVADFLSNLHKFIDRGDELLDKISFKNQQTDNT